MRTRIAIRGELTREGGVGDEQRAAFGTHAGEAAEAAARPDGTRRALREGIVAAGVEQNDLLRRARYRIEQLLEVDGASWDLLVAIDLHVDRREHVLAEDFEPMAGVVDESHRGGLGLNAESFQRIEKFRAGRS